MCGLAGILGKRSLDGSVQAELTAMRDALTHRGPDDAGLWLDLEAGIGLSHRRLSIIDVSKAGHQPMHSSSERYCLAFNGEIYNHQDMRASLEEEGHQAHWRGTSDTEVLLAAIEAYGLEKTLQLCRGMFALALWDKRDRALFLARDPFGEKPLYVARIADHVVFASELKAIAKHPSFDGTLDRQALVQCLRHGYIPAPRTLYTEVQKALPGEIIRIEPDRLNADAWQRSAYWDPLEEAITARENRFVGSQDEAVEALEDAIRVSVKRQSLADVPLGAFLSGGIDSSTVVALMQAERSTPVDTFSLGFEEGELDEAAHAKAIAQHLGTRHRDIYLTGADALELVTSMPSVYDEPFTDNSQLPTYLLSQFARQYVTVALSGDAGDELFAGYRRYASFSRRWQKGQHLDRVRQFGRALTSALSGFLGERSFGGAGANASPALVAYERFFTLYEPAHQLVLGGEPEYATKLKSVTVPRDWSVIEQATFLDLIHYLPDNILTKVDRAAMAHSLETRIPLLDPDIVRFSFALPDELKQMNAEPKGILKAVLSRHVPRALWDRPKRGFSVPTNAWLEKDFRELAGDLLSPERIRKAGVFDHEEVARVWAQFRAGNRKLGPLIWALFITQLYMP